MILDRELNVLLIVVLALTDVLDRVKIRVSLPATSFLVLLNDGVPCVLLCKLAD